MDNSIDTGSARIWLRDDGIVQMLILPDVERTLERIKQNAAAVAEVSQGQKRPVLADMRQMNRKMSAEARRQIASKRVGELVAAVAFLVGSPLSRITGNFFLGLNRASYPARVFTDADDAIQWLKQFL